MAFDRNDLLKSSTLVALSRDDSAVPVLLSTKMLTTPAKISALIQGALTATLMTFSSFVFFRAGADESC